ncbi:hypothetical protein HQ563_01865 [bacterium]|nr:hypothetical protein [bacterium]
MFPTRAKRRTAVEGLQVVIGDGFSAGGLGAEGPHAGQGDLDRSRGADEPAGSQLAAKLRARPPLANGLGRKEEMPL